MEKEQKDLATKFARTAVDTGSPEVQCEILTGKIRSLTQHLKENPKDFQSRRGLLTMVKKRKRSIRYLEKSGRHDMVQKLIQELGIRK